jgi:hypothetical protein
VTAPAGNNTLNILGNISRHPPCANLLLDFASRDIVQLSANATPVQAPDARNIVLDITHTRHWVAASDTSKE